MKHDIKYRKAKITFPNAVISVNSTSPAYVYLFAKAVIDGAVDQGIDGELAKQLISKTLVGSAKMIMESGKSPDELIKMVASPGGTTLKALVHEQFGDGIISAINFRLDVKKVADPDGGERAVITLDGKYLPTVPF